MTTKSLAKRDRSFLLSDFLPTSVDKMFNLNRLFPSWIDQPMFLSKEFFPAMDAEIVDNNIMLTLDVPGLSKEDIVIDYADGYLTVSGERKSESVKEDNGNKHVERSYGSFSRKQYLGEIDESQIKATMENGVLKIEAPLQKEKSKEQHRIAIT